MHVKDMLVVLIDGTQVVDESMRTCVTDDGQSVYWLAAGSLASSRPHGRQVEFQHCRQSDCLVEDAPASIAVTHEPCD